MWEMSMMSMKSAEWQELNGNLRDIYDMLVG